MLKVVFFDAAGTLIDTRRPVGQSYAALARDYGVTAKDAAITAAFRRAFNHAPGLSFGPGHPPDELRRMERQWWHDRVRETFAGLGRFDDFESYFNVLFDYFADPASWVVYEDVVETLSELRKQGLELGVISNFDTRLFGLLKGLGLAELFQSVTISSQAGWSKPAPELYRSALARHQAGPDQALHVGDSPNLDIAGAKAAGLEAILVMRRAANVPSGTASPQRPDLVVASLREVLAYVHERDRTPVFARQGRRD